MMRTSLAVLPLFTLIMQHIDRHRSYNDINPLQFLAIRIRGPQNGKFDF